MSPASATSCRITSPAWTSSATRSSCTRRTRARTATRARRRHGRVGAGARHLLGALQAQAPAWEPQAQAPAWEPPRQYEAPYKQRAREFQNCRGGKTSSGRSRARTKAAMADATASAPALANALRGYIAMRGGSIQAQQLAEFYKSPACAAGGPEGWALKLLRNVENSGLRFTHMPHLNKWIIALDHDAPPPPPSSDLGASAPAFVPGARSATRPWPRPISRFAPADVSGRAPTDRTTAKQRRLAKRAAAREAGPGRAGRQRREPDPRRAHGVARGPVRGPAPRRQCRRAPRRRRRRRQAPVTASGGTTTTGYVKARHPSGAKKKIFVPTARPWTRLGHNQPKHAFTVVSYNVLSQKLLDVIDTSTIRCCDRGLRLANLQKEIGRYGAQIVCLQEIEPEHLEAFRGCVRTFKNDDRDIKRGAEVAFAPCGEPRTDGVAVLVDAGGSPSFIKMNSGWTATRARRTRGWS